MRNRFNDYGSQLSDLSAYNPRAQTPPLLFKDRELIGIAVLTMKLELIQIIYFIKRASSSVL